MNLRKLLSVAFIAAVTAVAAACGSTDSAETVGSVSEELTIGGTLSQACSEPAGAYGQATAWDCSNSPGPWITFDGTVVEAGLNLRVIFTNNAKFTHETTADVGVSVSVIPAGETITIPKQPSHGGVGGNPFIYVQFVDGSGAPLSGEILLGRCVQGALPLSGQLTEALTTSFTLDDVQCGNNPGPYITFEGSIVSKGVSARLIFKNAPNGPHVYAVEGDLVVTPAGTSVTIPKQPVLGGSGGNPWIYLEWTDSSGKVLSGPTLLGRCNKL